MLTAISYCNTSLKVTCIDNVYVSDENGGNIFSFSTKFHIHFHRRLLHIRSLLKMKVLIFTQSLHDRTKEYL